MTGSLDLTFTVTGAMLECDYASGLYRALVTALPWLDDEPMAGVHAVRGLTPCAGGLLIGGRTRMVLRIPAERAEQCARLQGVRLELPAPLKIGGVTQRALLPYPVLHARLVITGADNETDFIAEVQQALTQLDIDCEIIVGRRGELRIDAQEIIGFSLMLHGLTAEESLRAQEQGIGRHRKFGCGLFVPHKSVAAVGT